MSPVQLLPLEATFIFIPKPYRSTPKSVDTLSSSPLIACSACPCAYLKLTHKNPTKLDKDSKLPVHLTCS